MKITFILISKKTDPILLSHFGEIFISKNYKQTKKSNLTKVTLNLIDQLSC